MSEPVRQSVLFQGLADRPILAAFDEPSVTTNGGALLLGVLDRRLGLTERFRITIDLDFTDDLVHGSQQLGAALSRLAVDSDSLEHRGGGDRRPLMNDAG